MQDVGQVGTLSTDYAVFIVGSNPAGNKGLHADAWDERHIGPLKCFLADAEPLVQCLDHPEVRSAVDSYRTLDQEAVGAQARYMTIKRYIAWAFAFALAVSVCAAFFSPRFLGVIGGAIAGWFGADEREWAFAVEHFWQFHVGWVVLLGLGTPCLAGWMKPDQAFQDWKKARAMAERMRQETFNRVMDFRSASNNPTHAANLLVLKLEYFRRWQVEVQHSYFVGRGREKRKLTERPSFYYRIYGLLATVLLLTVVLVLLGGGDEHGHAHPDWMAVLLAEPRAVAGSLLTFQIDRMIFAGIVVALCASALAWHRAELGSAWVSAARFEVMTENFEEALAAQLEAARQGARAFDEIAVRRYVERVHGMMQIEFSEWVRLGDLDVGRAHPHTGGVKVAQSSIS